MSVGCLILVCPRRCCMGKSKVEVLLADPGTWNNFLLSDTHSLNIRRPHSDARNGSAWSKDCHRTHLAYAGGCNSLISRRRSCRHNMICCDANTMRYALLQCRMYANTIRYCLLQCRSYANTVQYCLLQCRSYSMQQASSLYPKQTRHRGEFN